MKPVGLKDPRSDERPFAVVQLRLENLEGTAFNMVGFQTRLKYPEQQRVFSMIPGLQEACFLRLGSIHRNTYINAPSILKPSFQTERRDNLFFAGQISGVEGYTESAASGLMAGRNAAALALGEPIEVPPPETALGALSHYIAYAAADPRVRVGRD